MQKLKKRVKLFELADGAQVIVIRGVDTDREEIVRLKIYTEIKGTGTFVDFEVPLVSKDKAAADLLFKNTQKLKDFAIGVYNSQMPQLDGDFNIIINHS